ncbi:DUF2325 domain-containing protein [Candidatus Formimonas warabiya]|uniref:DUF2325 domain-containing protein n=1 Tax=Formimonas warabiya TaxID=1761012 RepID=UPI001BE4DC37|nr:DUF2325 domain-containing protein [Candidatus Formimonas warabiya]
MVVLIVGADRLGNICEKLREEGAQDIIHWSGRCKSCTKKCIPAHVQKIIVFCDFINHPLMGNIKKQAKKYGIPVIYSKRAISFKEDLLPA